MESIVIRTQETLDLIIELITQRHINITLSSDPSIEVFRTLCTMFPKTLSLMTSQRHANCLTVMYIEPFKDPFNTLSYILVFALSKFS